MTTKKTKVVCTIGPATSGKPMMVKLLKAGMNVARLNFSHGEVAEHQTKVDNLREAIKETGVPVAILQDLSGPKFRLGDFKEGAITVNEGDLITLTSELVPGDKNKVSVNYPTLAAELKEGDTVMIDDGRKQLTVVAINGSEVQCKVVIGGELRSRRSLNLPGADLKIRALTPKDKTDLQFAFKNDLDFVAFSFVRFPEEVVELRELLNANKSRAKIIAKIETKQAVENFAAILKVADGIMVARGDLAVEIGPENVPLVQKQIIIEARNAGKPVITATQMLESMIDSSTPTRAEVSDVANAILDGTDAVMLSEETTLGHYPVEAVKMMTKIAKRVEGELEPCAHFGAFIAGEEVADVTSHVVVDTANHLDAKFIAALTNSGFTALTIARYRPAQRILALTPHASSANHMLLSYGVLPVVVPEFKSLDEIMELVRRYALENNLAKSGEPVVLAGGWPFGQNIDTNMMVVETI